MQSIGSAPTKLLLFGEHSAVYGHPAIGIPLNWKITVKIEDAENTRWKIDRRYLERLNPLLSKLHEVFPELLSLSPQEFAIESEAPIGVGFGSSGALCVALTRAIFAKIRLSPEPNAIWERAHKLETFFHSNPSGVDTGISTIEKCGYLVKSNKELPLFLPLQENFSCLIAGAFPRSSNTSELVTGLRKRLNTNQELMWHIEKLGEITEQAKDQLATADVFGKLASSAHSHLQALGLSIPELDLLLEQARSLGACGGKLSGAGGGGAFYIVCENRRSAEEIIKQLIFPKLLTPCIIN